ncbi:amylo-alpha-1,6-glucosidase [Halobacillus litoralis]|uniref:Amylo-alpha-1,6-glucosidase n=1 Tax=Halobacillus litoralis TaxID=45668 RepID=A0A845DN49_9BACI|nr:MULTISPECIES: amylo-alpha-1,6-glucosidase [Halobacillus]MYL18658.1 amylo-alpha-1,6-glucosidase [Halobacillus litoralis]MYL31595.1 amylo-alpha-1,6-glucosidase [Halobacillus halophilus]
MDYRVIKSNDVFLLTDKAGNIPLNHTYGLGLYTKDTRFLSQFDIQINGEDLVLLSSEADDNSRNEFILTNPHMEEDGEIKLWRESIEVKRTRFIVDGVWYESIKLKSYYPEGVSFQTSIHFNVDFADMFIVRGFQNGKTGSITEREMTDHSYTYHYLGADDLKRSTTITWNREAASVDEDGHLYFDFSLRHGEEEEIVLTIVPEVGEEAKGIDDIETASKKLLDSQRKWDASTAKVKTDLHPLQKLIDRGLDDLHILQTDLGYGSFPVAGLPWFGVPFGRDSLIAALQLLPLNPEIAEGTLRTMARYQGTTVDTWRDEQPGKIMHELRFGELANTNQVPFTPYYGSIDSTPLFLVLLVEYVKWTGNKELVKDLWENMEAALNWIDEYGDRDNDGFVEYFQEAGKGIANQGWKDSGDSIVHNDGRYAEAPIALAEVQGYVYQAKMGLADVYKSMGFQAKGEILVDQCRALQSNFERAFWMEDKQYFAIALDKDKKQVGTMTSNPGHVLSTGILFEHRTQQVAETLISDRLFSGYGVRTMAEGEAGYNPMSYHDGSVWPHDNSMILLGLGRCKHFEEASVIMNGLVKAADHFEYNRLPELFCGYSDNRGRPVHYPVACSPQAWAAGTPLTFIPSLLGLFPNVLEGTVDIHPNLLDGMNELHIDTMRLGDGHISFIIRRGEHENEVEVTQNTTGLTINVQQSMLI